MRTQENSVRTEFRFTALAAEAFAALHALDDDELRARGMRRMIVDEKPGFPCRVSLVDAEPGERVILLTHTHHDVDSPYRGSGPIFVREAATTATFAPGEIPEMLRTRLLSLRAYDRDAMMIGCEVVEGRDLEAAIERQFGNPAARYLHVHNARHGCFNCTIERA